MRVSSEPRHPDGFPLQTGDAVDVFMAEQNEAADMYAGQQGGRFSLIEAKDEIRRVDHHQIHVPARQLLGGVRGGSSTKWMSVKPSACSNCSGIICGMVQIAGSLGSLM